MLKRESYLLKVGGFDSAVLGYLNLILFPGTLINQGQRAFEIGGRRHVGRAAGELKEGAGSIGRSGEVSWEHRQAASSRSCKIKIKILHRN